ncbi:PREDICTED: ectonucleoside triphosphate diphosphohydrolase 3 isoform X2 [Cyprinodon variegatus]|uniref:Ectonucleoside triphosphate diphosphohydrolase 3 n=2 Tax=Cyprinodon variegatus TaxID=28743 RepID=A0A3Q2G6J6_CYPVA|nr:PREDICTED: ectonucleoside triphosphate diphosphohydrolase 3 isoform X2 [Cyprinodon variegatus]
MASQKKIGYKCRIAGVMLLLLGSIAALVVVAVIQDKLKVEEYGSEYGIVIDSGSSRSNVYLYEWPGEKENETGVVKEKMNCAVKGVPISELKVSSKDDETTFKAFQDCMDDIKRHIPEEKHKTTPLFLGATAGMRLLHAKDKKRSDEIMTSLREYLSGLNFEFHNASIITGQEEGLYGWITVNYLKGNFLEKNMWNTYVRPNGAETFGSMDLGGASTQIAFQVQEKGQGPDYMLVKLYGYPYTIYTHSFLCYGKNEADKRVLDKIIKESSDPAYIINPCYPDGFNYTMSASAIYDTECTMKPKNYKPDLQFFMVGKSDSKKCGEIVKSIFDFKNCSSKMCSFNGVEQPPVTGEFMAYAGFFYIARALGMNGTSKLEEFNISVGNFCQTYWTELKTKHPKIHEKFLKTYCFASHYVLTLLADGYKFDEETWKNIHFEKTVKETNIGWSLGYMLSMSNMIPSEVKVITPMTNPVFAGLIFLFSALIIITVVLGFIILIRTCY